MTISNPLSQGPASVGAASVVSGVVTASWEEQVAKLIEEVLGVIDIEEAFCGFVKQSEENEVNKFMGATLSFKQFWNAQNLHVSCEEQDKVLKLFIQVGMKFIGDRCRRSSHSCPHPE